MTTRASDIYGVNYSTRLLNLHGEMWVRLGNAGTMGISGVHWEFSFNNSQWFVLGSSDGLGGYPYESLYLSRFSSGIVLHLLNDSSHPIQVYDYTTPENYDTAFVNVTATLASGGGYHSGDIRLDNPWDTTDFKASSQLSFRDPNSSVSSDINIYGKTVIRFVDQTSAGTLSGILSTPSQHPAEWASTLYDTTKRNIYGNFSLADDLLKNRGLHIKFSDFGYGIHGATGGFDHGNSTRNAIYPTKAKPYPMGKGIYIISCEANIGTTGFVRGSDGADLNGLEAGTVVLLQAYVNAYCPAYFRLTITDGNKTNFPIRINMAPGTYTGLLSSTLNVFSYDSTYDDTRAATHTATVSVTSDTKTVFVKERDEGYLYEIYEGNADHPGGVTALSIRRRVPETLAIDGGYNTYLYGTVASASKVLAVSDRNGNLFCKVRAAESGNDLLRKYSFSAMTGNVGDNPINFLRGNNSSEVTLVHIRQSHMTIDYTNNLLFVILSTSVGNRHIYLIDLARLDDTKAMTVNSANPKVLDGYSSLHPWVHLVTVQNSTQISLSVDETNKRLCISGVPWDVALNVYATNHFLDYTNYASYYGSSLGLADVAMNKTFSQNLSFPDLQFRGVHNAYISGFGHNGKFFLMSSGGGSSTTRPAQRFTGPSIVEVDPIDRTFRQIFSWDLIGSSFDDHIESQPNQQRYYHFRGDGDYGGHIAPNIIRSYTVPSTLFTTLFSGAIANLNPFGGTITWDSIGSATKYKVEAYVTSSGYETKVVLTDTNTSRSLNVSTLTEGTHHTIRFYGYVSELWEYQSGADLIVITPPAVSASDFDNLAIVHSQSKSRLQPNGSTIAYSYIDFNALTNTQTTSMKAYLQSMSNVTTGQRIRMKVTVRGRVATRETRLVKRSGTFNLDTDLDVGVENILYIPFSSTAGSGQKVTFVLAGSSVDMTYDESNNQITFQSVTYNIGDSFFITTNSGVKRRITVFAGSIILVIESAVPNTVPASNTQIVAQDNMGKAVMKHSTCRALTMIGGNDTTPGTMQSEISWYGYDSTSGSTDPAVHTKEGFRMVHTLNGAKDTGTMSLLALRKDSGGDLVLENVMEMQAGQTNIRATDNTGSTITTLDTEGMKNDNNSWAIYFGDNKQFRIKFTTSPIERIVIEATASNESTTYIEKGSFSRI